MKGSVGLYIFQFHQNRLKVVSLVNKSCTIARLIQKDWHNR